MIAGAKGWLDIREYILGQHHWFKRNGLFLHGVPADDTIARIISTIELEQFHECFINWISLIHTLTEDQVIAIDGKMVDKISLEKGKSVVLEYRYYISSKKLSVE